MNYQSFDGASFVLGGPQDDDLQAGPGVFDVLKGLGGDDRLNGGDGPDVAYYSGGYNDYQWSRNTDGSWSVRDLRAGSPDGQDRLVNVEILAFTDGIAWIGDALPTSLQLAFSNILRVGATAREAGMAAVSVGSNLSIGKLAGAAVADVWLSASGTTSVATMTYQFFTGRTPTESGLDYLVSPTGPNPHNLNSAYYQNVSIENRYIGFAVNLAKSGEGASFQADYGGLTFADATRKAYAVIFGSAPSDAKVQALVQPRAGYLAELGGDGADGIGTKAAMVGWLLSEAVKYHLGPLARANAAYLTDLADGAGFGVDLIGAYASPDPALG